MDVRSTEIPEVRLVEPRMFGDSRGFFFEAFNRSKLEAALRQGRGGDVSSASAGLRAREPEVSP
jgi:dTDP-4-dehydrorhamnose 3,5-epimerase-like enzyme